MQGAVKSQSFEPHIRQVQLSMFRHSSSYLWWITATNSVGESDKSQTATLSTARSGGNYAIPQLHYHRVIGVI